MGNPALTLVRTLAVIGIGLFLGTATVRAAEILVNPGFETGVLTPWFQDRNEDGSSINWSTTTPDAHTGTFSATEIGNVELRQNFLAVPVSSILEVSFWIKHPDLGVTAIAGHLFYTDTTDTLFVFSTTTADWEFLDVTSFLEPGKALTGFSVFGNHDGITFFDDAQIRAAAVLEPGALVLFGTGFMGLLGFGWRGRKRADKTA